MDHLAHIRGGLLFSGGTVGFHNHKIDLKLVDFIDFSQNYIPEFSSVNKEVLGQIFTEIFD